MSGCGARLPTGGAGVATILDSTWIVLPVNGVMPVSAKNSVEPRL